ncbi:MAG: hypothetical protein JF616_04155 [Fibrobacteres bacterium]|nr:hypothetical protein [Fibrobacterota bacterium]
MHPSAGPAASLALSATLLFASPAFTADWKDAGLPGGGWVSNLARLPATSQSPAALIAGTEPGAIYRSLDGGVQWERVLPDAGEPIRSLLVDGDIVLAAAGTRADIGLWDCFGPYGSCPSPWANGGMFRSTDRGGTWQRVKADSLDGAVLGLARTNAAWYAAGGSWLWSSADKGATWKRVPPDTGWVPYSSAMSAFVSDGVRLYAVARQGLYSAQLDAPRGVAWKREPGLILALAAGPDRIYLSAKPDVNPVQGGFNADGIYSRRSFDLTWRLLSPDTAAALAVDGDTVLAGSAAAMRVSRNVGASWNPFAMPLPNLGRTGTLLVDGAYAFAGGGDSLGIRKAAFASGGWTYLSPGLRDYSAYARFAGGVLFSNDAYGDLLRQGDQNTWSKFPLGISNYIESTRKLLISQMGRYALIGANSGFYSLDPAGTWNRLDNVQVDGIARGEGWVATFQEAGWYLRSCVANDYLVCAPSHLTGFPSKGPYAGTTPLRHFRGMTARGDSLYLGIDSILYRSGDRGDSWQAAGKLPDWIFSLGFAGDRLYGMPPSGGSPLGSKLLSAWDDAARAWQPQDLAGVRGAFREAAFRGQELYLATDSGLFARAAGGTDWVDLSGGLPQADLRSVAVQGDTLAVGLMQGGLFTRKLGPETTGMRGQSRPLRIARPRGIWTREYRADGRLRPR